MNIYKITIDQNGYNLRAVVVAGNEKDAVRIMDLDSNYEIVEHVSKIGVALCGTKAGEVARETL